MMKYAFIVLILLCAPSREMTKPSGRCQNLAGLYKRVHRLIQLCCWKSLWKLVLLQCL